MSSPVFKSGNTALITGGASGIGLALATKCAGYGMNVVVCDNNSSNLASAQEAIKGKGKISTVEMDVSKVEDFEKLKGLVEKDFGGMSLPFLRLYISALFTQRLSINCLRDPNCSDTTNLSSLRTPSVLLT